MDAEIAIKYLRSYGEERISVCLPDQRANEIADLISDMETITGAARENFNTYGCLPVNCTYCTAANCGHKELGKALAKLDGDKNDA